jgi:23S rRNA (uracil1939-C5)-methyltransferase
MRLTIAELAPGGDGVAITDIGGERRAVFVRGGAPGDELQVAVDGARRPARGRVLAIVTPGAGRVASPCPHVERCGGCDWMHLSAAAQVEALRSFVWSALPVAWRKVTIVTHAATERLGYRRRARLHVRVTGGRAIVGMHGAGTHEPVPVDACVVLDPALERARRALPALFDGAHGRGEVQLGLGRDGERADRPEPVLDVRWSGALAAACFGRLERGVADGLWAGARVLYGDAARPAVVGDPTPWMRGADGLPLRLAAGGFAQASDEANAALGARIAGALESMQVARPSTPLRAVELYAGAGNFTALLAARGHAVTSVESSRAACDAARANLVARGLSARVVEADADGYEWPAATDVVLLDPPRAGAVAVARRLAAAPVRHVLYVSCDPTTLGRDLALLEPAYDAVAIETFEMFPQTSHVETLVRLDRKQRRRAAGDAAS